MSMTISLNIPIPTQTLPHAPSLSNSTLLTPKFPPTNPIKVDPGPDPPTFTVRLCAGFLAAEPVGRTREIEKSAWVRVPRRVPLCL